MLSSTVAASLLGLAFWAAAARAYPEAAVGRASALISLALLLAAVISLNLTDVFLRFLPDPGTRQRRLVLMGYLAVAVGALVVVPVFLALPISAELLPSGAGARALLGLAVVSLCFFLLQDAVLVGVSRPRIVPVENVLTGVARLGMLIALVSVGSGTALLAAWTVPAALAVVLVSGWLLVRGLASGPADGPVVAVGTSRLRSLVAAEYVGSLLGLSAIYAPPLLVAQRLGVVENAYFILPWLACTSAQTLLYNVAGSFLVDSVDRGGLSASTLRTLSRLAALVVLPITLLPLLAARPALALLGAGYAEGSTALLQLVALATPFTAVFVLYATLARLRGHMWELAVVTGAVSGTFVLASLPVMDAFGIEGIGALYLAVQAAAALAVLPATRLRLLRSMTEPTALGRG